MYNNYDLKKEISDMKDKRAEFYKPSLYREIKQIKKYKLYGGIYKLVYLNIDEYVKLSATEFKDLYSDYIREVHRDMYDVEVKDVDVSVTIVGLSKMAYEITIKY